MIPVRVYAMPKWLVAVLLLAAGAGAAVGPVLAARLTSGINLTATQAVSVRNVPAAILNPQTNTRGPLTETDAQYGLITGSPGILLTTATMGPCYTAIYQLSGGGTFTGIPANARSFVSLNDTGTDFTVAVDMLPTSSKFDVAVPLYNSANNQQLERLTLDIPDGLLVDLESIRLAAAGVTTANKASIGRLTANTWEITLQPNLGPGTYDDFISITDATLNHTVAAPASGFIIHVALQNGTPPGFYAIRGRLEAENK